ncbi:MAG: SRPBCC family protein [Stellaceae bacterium]
MKIENGFDLPLSAAEAWRVLLDIERVARCVPGAELIEKLDPDSYRGKIAVRLGPVALSFNGTARFIEIDEAARRVRVKANGSESKGRGGAEASAQFALAEIAPRQTHVAIATDLALNGSVAQYGRGAAMIGAVAQQLVDQFAARLAAELSSAAAAPAGIAAPPRPISGFRLVFAALWRAVRRMFAPRSRREAG